MKTMGEIPKLFPHDPGLDEGIKGQLAQYIGTDRIVFLIARYRQEHQDHPMTHTVIYCFRADGCVVADWLRVQPEEIKQRMVLIERVVPFYSLLKPKICLIEYHHRPG